MQTLGVSNSTPPSENRLKNLFWPTISTATDVDTLGTQGYWICAIVAVLALASSILAGQPISGVLLLLFYFLGGPVFASTAATQPSLFLSCFSLKLFLDLAFGNCSCASCCSPIFVRLSSRRHGNPPCPNQKCRCASATLGPINSRIHFPPGFGPRLESFTTFIRPVSSH
jgi:hypothetical protein